MSTRRPNLLVVMADQLAPHFLPSYGHPIVPAPNIARLADRGVTFDNAYCNSPLCAPSRFSMMAGRHPSRIGAYDNAALFPADVPTFAHYLRAIGYRTVLAGKMHFVGPDQRHGFEHRVTTDIYPADFGWTPDWERPEKRPFWYHDMDSVLEAGVYERTLALDFDEAVAYAARRALLDAARAGDERPFCVVASFTQPHDPYMTPAHTWARIRHESIDMPVVPAADDADPHTRRLRHVIGLDEKPVDEARIRNARHAYYGMIAWVDDRIGELLDTLRACGRADDTIVLVLADHGDMLGEHGLWYKMCFHEPAVRVPLIVAGAGVARGERVAAGVSLVDLLPTLLDLAGDGASVDLASPVDGRSLAEPLSGGRADVERTVVSEFLGEGAAAPMIMVRRDRHKYVAAPGDPPQLFDVEADPHERVNLVGDASLAEAETSLAVEAAAHWDADAVHASVIDSQRRRRAIHAAMVEGEATTWDWTPLADGAREYNRNLGGEMYDTDRRARIRGEAPGAS